MAWVADMARRAFGRRNRATSAAEAEHLLQQEQLIAAADSAICALRPLYVDSPTSGIGAHLAEVLRVRSRTLVGLERFGEALPAADELVQVYRWLVADDRDAYEPDLSDALDLYSVVLAGVDRFDEALSPVDQSIEIQRRLVADDLSCEPVLAETLASRSRILANLERFAEALTAAVESAEIQRRLAAADPDREPVLADTLILCGALLASLDRPEEAQHASDEATEILHRRVDITRLRAEAAVAKFLNGLEDH